MEDITAEIIDITLDSPTINLNSSRPASSSFSSRPSVNFGGGIELLMNDKKRSDGKKSPANDIDLGDL
jgi:hypothetical protein